MYKVIKRIKLKGQEIKNVVDINGKVVHFRRPIHTDKKKEYIVEIRVDDETKVIYGDINEVSEQNDEIRLLTYEKKDD